MPWLYCLEMFFRHRDCPEKKIYKFGKTNKPDPNKRLNAYNGMNKIAKILVINYVENADLLEHKMLEELKNKYEFLPDTGNEWFWCDNEDELYKFIKDLEKKYYNYEESDEDEDEDEEGKSLTTSIKPINFTLNGVTYQIPNLTWRSLTTEVIKKIFAISGLSQIEFEQKLVNNNNKKFRINDDTMRVGKTILDNSNVYIELHGSRKVLIKTCQKIALLFQVDFKYTK
mgnify:CR=1 FL=1